jgi:hypothetical protein
MTIHIHLGSLWLIIPAAVVYGLGVIIGLAMSLFGDPSRWFRLLVLAWPLVVLALLAARLYLFMAGRDLK